MKSKTPFTMVSVFMMSAFTINAQNYNFTLIQNSDYNFTVAAVSEFDSGSFQPITQSYGFTLVLPDGITITLDEVLPAGTNETVTAIPGGNVAGIDATMADKELYLITTDTAGQPISTHGNGELIPLVTLTVNGDPSTGEIRLLDNASTLASAPALNGALDAFFQVDVTDDSTVNFNNEFNMLSGIAAISFDTLSVEDLETPELTGVSLYPNPAKDEVQIQANGHTITKLEVFDINGKRVLATDTVLARLDVRGLESAMYLVKLYDDSGAATTVKLVKE